MLLYKSWYTIPSPESIGQPQSIHPAGPVWHWPVALAGAATHFGLAKTAVLKHEYSGAFDSDVCAERFPEAG